MSLTESMKDIAESTVALFEARNRSTEVLFAATHQIPEGFQNSFLDFRREREQVNAQLRENLTQNESLRRKDFDRMMQGILSAQEEREKQVRERLNRYFIEQREMMRALGDNLAQFKEALARGEAQRLKEFQVWLQEILAKQDERKQDITAELKEFQKQQQTLAHTLKELLAKGRELRIKDLKRMLGEFQVQRRERIAGQDLRKREVRVLRDEFAPSPSSAVKGGPDRPQTAARVKAGLRMEG